MMKPATHPRHFPSSPKSGDTAIGRILVTGATSGIGLATAHVLARDGWHVLLHGRNPDKAHIATKQVLAANPLAAVTPVSADLADLTAVKRLALSLAGEPLRAVVHNATAANFTGERSVQGHELTFAVGQLAPWVLTMSLLPTLIRQGSGGVIWLSSQSHSAARLAATDIVARAPESADAAYARTKLANLALHFALAMRWKGSSVQSVAFDPGPTETPLMATLRDNNDGMKGWLLRRVVPLFSKSAEIVAEDVAWTIHTSLSRGSQGSYFGAGRRQIRAAARASDPERGAAVIAACEAITGVAYVDAHRGFGDEQ